MALPTSNFIWEKDFSHLDWENMSDHQETGYILQVDLEYPQHLHEQHNSFPLAPESVEITRDMLSPYSKGNFFEKPIFF